MDTETQPQNLEELTVAQLKDMADHEEIQVSSHATKDEIIKAIKKGRKANGPTNGPSVAKNAKPAAADAEAEGEKPELMSTPTEEHPEVSPLALTGPVITIPPSDIIADAYGIGRKYNIQLADLVALGAVLQGNFLLDNLSPGAIVQYTRVKHSASVAGGGIATCTAQLGDGTNLWGAALDVFQAPSPTALNTAQLSANNLGPFNAVYPVYLTVIATVGNLGGATAGAISAWIRWTPIA